jgi:hypothetical protein
VGTPRAVVGFLLAHADVAYSEWQNHTYVPPVEPTEVEPPAPKIAKTPAANKIVKTSKHLVLAELAKEGIFPRPTCRVDRAGVVAFWPNWVNRDRPSSTYSVEQLNV